MRTNADKPLPPAPPPFRWISQDILELRERNVFAAFFGAPFLLAGFFLFLGAIGVLPSQAKDEDRWAPVLTMGLISLAFLAFGSGLVFSRRSLKLDLTRRSLTRQRLPIPIHIEMRLLSDFSAVMLAYDPGDSDSPVRYPVRFHAIHGSEFVVSTDTEFDDSLMKAEFLSKALRLPFVDATTDHRTVIAPERVGEALKERLQSVNAGAEHVDRPPELRSEVTMAVGQTTIVLFGVNIVPPIYLAFGPVIALLFVMPVLSRRLSRGAPTGSGSAIFTFLVLLVGAPAIIWWFNRTFSHWIRRTTVTASPAGLVIEERHLFGSSRTNVPGADILDVDCRSVESAWQSAKAVFVDAMPVSQSMPHAQWIFTVLKKLVPSQGIIVKSRQGLITFGEGLPEVELRYLVWILRRALSGR